jgi:kumamolisin
MPTGGTVPFTSYIRRPRAAASALTAAQVAEAYNYPVGTGQGVTIGVIELGGAVNAADLKAAGIDSSRVHSKSVAGGKPKSDGPNGADGEVALDVQIIAELLPEADINVYDCPNTDAGFLAGFQAAHADDVTAISVSWGGPESAWSKASALAISAEIAACKADGINVYCASGDQGSKDGTRANVADFPASAPDAIACGGTELFLNASGYRSSEVAWDDNDTSSASGGGLSGFFAGRAVPDFAGNASPNTGYPTWVDGGEYVIGGTSAVAPLYAALDGLISQALGAKLGSKGDLRAIAVANPTVVFDVTSGDNGGYRAGPGRDQVTGFGVVDGSRLLAAVNALAPTPPAPTVDPVDQAVIAVLDPWAAKPHAGGNRVAANAWKAYRAQGRP